MAILLGLIATAVLSFGLTAGAAPEGGASGDDEIGAAKQRLSEFRMEAGSAYEAHDNAVFELAKLDDEIAATGEELAAAQDELDAAEGELQERAAQMYKSGNVGFVDVLVGAEDFSEFANRLELWMDLIIQERDEFDRVREARDALAQKKADLEAQRDKRAAALADADAQIDRASGLEADAQAYLDSLDAELREAMEAEQARQVQLAEEEALAIRRGAIRPAEEEAVPEEEPALEEAVPEEEAAPEEEPAPALVPVRGKTVDQALADRRAEREAAEAYAAEKAAAAEEARLAAEQAQAAEDAEAMLEAAEAAERRAALADERAARRAEEEAAAQAEAEQYAADQEAAERDLTPERGQYVEGGQYDGAGGGTTTPSAGGDQYGGDQYGGASTGAAGAQPSTGGASCADDFGGVEAHVAQIGCDLQNKFGLRITGIGYSDYHWDGLDLDVWTSDVALGNQVRDYAIANYPVEYTCWQDRYVNNLTGWEEGCAGHMDHVHITFSP